MTDTPEPRANIGFVCSLHAPTPQEHFATWPPEAFLGLYVKRGFGCTNGHVEHMWVLVDSITDEGALSGRLDNDPVYDCGLVCGDTVIVPRDQIEAVYSP
jgi:hypothetical protein